MNVTIGSVSLERIINHIGVVALYLYKPEGVWRTRYVSKNITEYGYTDGNFYSGLVGLSDLIPKSDYDVLIGHFSLILLISLLDDTILVSISKSSIFVF